MLLHLKCPVCNHKVTVDLFVDEDIETKAIYYELNSVKKVCKHKLKDETVLNMAIELHQDMIDNKNEYDPRVN